MLAPPLMCKSNPWLDLFRPHVRHLGLKSANERKTMFSCLSVCCLPLRKYAGVKKAFVLLLRCEKGQFEHVFIVRNSE